MCAKTVELSKGISIDKSIILLLVKEWKHAHIQ